MLFSEIHSLRFEVCYKNSPDSTQESFKSFHVFLGKHQVLRQKCSKLLYAVKSKTDYCLIFLENHRKYNYYIHRSGFDMWHYINTTYLGVYKSCLAMG